MTEDNLEGTVCSHIFLRTTFSTAGFESCMQIIINLSMQVQRYGYCSIAACTRYEKIGVPAQRMELW